LTAAGQDSDPVLQESQNFAPAENYVAQWPRIWEHPFFSIRSEILE
jgi:hypothetical protein